MKRGKAEKEEGEKLLDLFFPTFAIILLHDQLYTLLWYEEAKKQSYNAMKFIEYERYSKVLKNLKILKQPIPLMYAPMRRIRVCHPRPFT